MNAKYVCKTPSGYVITEANVMDSVEKVKAVAEKEHRVKVLDIVEELPIGTPPSELEEYSVPLRCRVIKR